MGLIALGINHKSANVALRERVAFAPEQMTEALLGALNATALREVVILSTCNRTELFGMVDDSASENHSASSNESAAAMDQAILQWLGDYHRVPVAELEHNCYCYRDETALRHLMQVASGLDSMVMGEPQILGQLKSAFAEAKQVGSIAAQLNRVFKQVFSVAKAVRTDTAIGENPVSVAFAAVNLSRQIFSDLSQTRALLIGAGETIELVARHLVDNGVHDIVVANRTLARGQELAQRFGAKAVLLAEIPEQLANVDIVISSTASQLPILGKGAVEHALKLRKHRPILMVDIAVPRDIEEQVGELEDIYLYTVDDLVEIVDDNKRSREFEARKADVIIDRAIVQHQQQLRALDAVATVKSLRFAAEQTRDSELEKAIKQLAKGASAEQAMAQLARNLTNKFVHKPSIEMKKASAAGRQDLIAWSHDLFGLEGVDDQHLLPPSEVDDDQ